LPSFQLVDTVAEIPVLLKRAYQKFCSSQKNIKSVPDLCFINNTYISMKANLKKVAAQNRKFLTEFLKDFLFHETDKYQH